MKHLHSPRTGLAGRLLGLAMGSLLGALLLAGAASAADSKPEPRGLLETLHRHRFLTSTIPDNGDVNPYAVLVAPVSVGAIEKDDVLVDNFNNISNLQGTGTTIVRYRPSTKETKLFAQVPQKLKDCPGGVGLSTAMAMLKSGWVIVGSTPRTDGTTATKGDGCMLVFDANGRHVATWSGPTINGPWGNMAVIDHGDRATLFISMAGFGLPGPDVVDEQTHFPVIKHQATVLRLELSIPAGQPPVLESQTVIADGFAQRADRDNFLFGPTGLALGPDDTLYVTELVAPATVNTKPQKTHDAVADNGVVKGDTITGGPGNTTIHGSAGDDLIDGGRIRPSASPWAAPPGAPASATPRWATARWSAREPRS